MTEILEQSMITVLIKSEDHGAKTLFVNIDVVNDDALWTEH